jgi:hypothetical protein
VLLPVPNAPPRSRPRHAGDGNAKNTAAPMWSTIDKPGDGKEKDMIIPETSNLFDESTIPVEPELPEAIIKRSDAVDASELAAMLSSIVPTESNSNGAPAVTV